MIAVWTAWTIREPTRTSPRWAQPELSAAATTSTTTRISASTARIQVSSDLLLQWPIYPSAHWVDLSSNSRVILTFPFHNFDLSCFNCKFKTKEQKTCRIWLFYQVKAARPKLVMLSSSLGSYNALINLVFVKLHRPSQEKKDGKQVLLKSRPSSLSLLHYRMSILTDSAEILK